MQNILESLSTVYSLQSEWTKETQQRARSVFKSMLLTRYMDEKMSKLVRQNKGATFHLSVSGHELIGALSAAHLIPGKDWGLPYYRDRAFAISLGSDLVDILGAFLARDVAHHSGGRMMPEHFSHKALRIPCQSSCVGSQFLQAVGVAKGVQLRGKDEVVYVSAGEGATSQGDLHEALNFSSIHKLPLLFVIQDNGYAISVPVKEQTAGGNFAKIARGYEGLAVFEVDGSDFLSCDEALQLATARARKGEGPSLILAKVVRLGAHSSSDDPKKYRCPVEMNKEWEKDPIVQCERELIQAGVFSQEEADELHSFCKEAIEKAAIQADALPFPKKEEADSRVFKEVTYPISSEPEITTTDTEAVVMMDALNHALIEEMEKDPGVVVFGQDVAKGKGGVFGITKQLTDLFGEGRCFNTPLAESTIVGLALGLSVDGFHKPVAEIQFADYSWTGMNQIANELASIYYRSNGEWNCPVVIRMPYGGYIQGGPYHSQSIEGFLAHCPGLKIVIPSNAADAKMLLKSAILDPNPVIFFEHKALYRQRAFCARVEPSSDAYLPLGQANIVQEGSDLTLIAWGMMVMMVNEIVQKLKAEGISVELIDLRTIVPLDKETIRRSVKKTGKVLIVHEAIKTQGFGAELAAFIAEEMFTDLDAPIERIGAKDCMVPYCKELEEAVLPNKEGIEKKIRELAAF